MYFQDHFIKDIFSIHNTTNTNNYNTLYNLKRNKWQELIKESGAHIVILFLFL